MSDIDKPTAAPSTEAAELDDRPPVLGSWRNIYVLVLSFLGVIITLFAILTEAYS